VSSRCWKIRTWQPGPCCWVPYFISSGRTGSDATKSNRNAETVERAPVIRWIPEITISAQGPGASGVGSTDAGVTIRQRGVETAVDVDKPGARPKAEGFAEYGIYHMLSRPSPTSHRQGACPTKDWLNGRLPVIGITDRPPRGPFAETRGEPLCIRSSPAGRRAERPTDPVNRDFNRREVC